MRILNVSNFFPPSHQGGYEQLCAEVSQALAQRGHEVHVLTGRTSRPRDRSHDQSVRVHGDLHLEVMGGVVHTLWRLVAERDRIENENRSAVQALLRDLRPDVALMWGLWNVPRAVPALLEHLMPRRVAYYFCDYWPTLPNAYVQQFEEPARRALTHRAKWVLGCLVRRLLAPTRSPALRFEHARCVSRAVAVHLEAAGIPVKPSEVLNQGIDVNAFAAVEAGRSRVDPDRIIRLLYAGRLTPIKGVHTAIRALDCLDADRDRLRLDVLGHGDADYEQSLRKLVQGLGLNDVVKFCDGVPRERMPAMLAEYDVLIFPSEWEEPLARMPMEAMAAGLVVVGTTTGGSGELLEHERNALTFQAGDPAGLARQLRRLVNDPVLRFRLKRAGQSTVQSRFTIDRMVLDLEAFLQDVARRSKA